jgi:biopolymer transport protein ExbD
MMTTLTALALVTLGLLQADPSGGIIAQIVPFIDIGATVAVLFMVLRHYQSGDSIPKPTHELVVNNMKEAAAVATAAHREAITLMREDFEHKIMKLEQRVDRLEEEGRRKDDQMMRIANDSFVAINRNADVIRDLGVAIADSKAISVQILREVSLMRGGDEPSPT